MALAYRLDAISQGPKNSRIPGPNPLPLDLVMDMHASKTLCTGCINHRRINSYYFESDIESASLLIQKLLQWAILAERTLAEQDEL